ncbi:Hypothetical predicted protein [Octopus vulgaris]|uniref:Uncharacterized protein n=1 Tax=Octopus vulgaris TaxID=6645 RepID=A0AA36AZH1_OCTVU|nr:Hypothetical predicted protein [Octopus vulgaris]
MVSETSFTALDYVEFIDSNSEEECKRRRREKKSTKLLCTGASSGMPYMEVVKHPTWRYCASKTLAQVVIILSSKTTLPGHQLML